jgi:hypothetical protein
MLKAMARIPEAEIERLKEVAPVERLAEASGIELKKGGEDLGSADSSPINARLM